jgi:hypothetical protein
MAGTLSWSLFLRFSSELHQIVRDLCELKRCWRKDPGDHWQFYSTILFSISSWMKT